MYFMAPTSQDLKFSDLSGWRDDDLTPAFAAFVQTARYHLYQKPYPQRIFEIDDAGFLAACSKAIVLDQTQNVTRDQMRQFFESYFTPQKVEADGFITGYYEPVIDVSLIKNDLYQYPFYKKPNDLIKIDDPSNPPDGVQKGYAFAKKTSDLWSQYPNRKQIEQGCLKGQGLEIAYAASKADVYFTHIQGSAKLRTPDGTSMRITYAAKSGHPYSSIGKILIEQGEISKDDMSMQSIRDWMVHNPSKIDALLWQNQSYIFFEELIDQDPELGPKGAAKTQLINGRSLAIDRHIYPFGIPIFITSELDIDNTGNVVTKSQSQPFSRLMIAQDTGSAITGSARGDIFVGSGKTCGDIAGQIQHKAQFFVLKSNSVTP
jgi:membrane-bound lytic murein transglycosylase A